MKEGYLILEDGSSFKGCLINGFEKIGEVVFNTSHSGYEEMATDPSYYNQILVTTAPMQGNYGVDKNRWESESIVLQAFVCVEIQNTKRDSAWLDVLTEAKVPVLTDVDTRSLALHLREQGSVWGGVFKENKVDEAIKKIKESKKQKEKLDWTAQVSTSKDMSFKGQGKKYHIGVLDFGCKKNIIRELVQRFLKVTLLPAHTSATEILKMNLDGLLLSNGPGDPKNVEDPVKEVKSLIGKIPMMGICMGNQILGRAYGFETYKLKFGHRGANHPILDKTTGKIYMSSQNHGYSLDAQMLKKNLALEVTHVNLNDSTVSGIQDLKNFMFAVQFHPESHPGPHEAVELFDHFARIVKSFEEKDAARRTLQSV